MAFKLLLEGQKQNKKEYLDQRDLFIKELKSFFKKLVRGICQVLAVPLDY